MSSCATSTRRVLLEFVGFQPQLQRALLEGSAGGSPLQTHTLQAIVIVVGERWC